MYSLILLKICLSYQLVGVEKTILTVESLHFTDIILSATRLWEVLPPIVSGSLWAPPELMGQM